MMNGDNKKIFIIVWSLIMWVCLACTQTHSGTTVVSNTVPGTVPAYVVLERVQADWTRVVVPAMAFGFSDSEVLQGSFSIGINDQLVQEQKGTSAYFTSLTETPTINIMVTDVKNGDQITLVIYQLSGRVLTYEGSVSLAQDIRAYLVTDFEEGGAVDLGQGMDLTHEARALTALDDGSLLIAAELRDQPEGAYLTNKFSVRRYTADGELDMTYASGLGVSVVDLDGFFETADDTLSGAQYYFGTSGDLWVLGDVYSQESVGQHYVSVIHVTAEGVPDENFGTDGRITIHPGNLYMGQVVLSMADNSLYFSLNDVDAPNGEMYLARITSEGVWDTSFGTDGLFPLGLTVIYDLKQDSEGNHIILSSSDAGGEKSIVVSRYLSDFVPDVSFGAEGTQIISLEQASDDDYLTIVSLEEAADQNILVFSTLLNGVTGSQDIYLTRLLPDGQLDNSFGENGTVSVAFDTMYAAPVGLLVLPEGQLMAYGSYTYDLGLLMFDESGQWDTSFSDDGIATSRSGCWDEAVSVVLSADEESIYVLNAAHNGLLQRFDRTGTLDENFGSSFSPDSCPTQTIQ